MIKWAFYQKNRDVILNREKDYYEYDKKKLREQTRINKEIYLKKIKIKRENIEETDPITYLKKRNKN